MVCDAELEREEGVGTVSDVDVRAETGYGCGENI